MHHHVSKSIGSGIRAFKSGAARQFEAQAASRLARSVALQANAALLCNGAKGMVLARDDRVCVSIEPTTGTVRVSINGTDTRVLIADAALFAQPQRLVLSVCSNGTANQAHHVTATLVEAPSRFARDFDTLRGQAESCAAPAEFAVAPQVCIFNRCACCDA